MRNTEVDIAEIISRHVPALIPGENLFVGRVPAQAKGQVVWVTTDATSVNPYLSDDDSIEVSMTVSIRGAKGRASYSDLQALAQEVWAALHRANTEPYTSILCTSLPETETDTDDAPIYSFEVEVSYQASNAGGPLVTLPASGPLRLSQVELDALTFADGSILTTAPDTPDLSEYVTLTGNQTLTHKILEDVIVSGTIYPALQGQTIGTEASPFGQLFLLTQPGQTPLEINQGNITNQRSIRISNAANGTTGIRYEGASGQGSWELQRSGQSYQMYLANRAMRHIATGRSFDSHHTGWSYSDRADDRIAFAITGGTNPTRTSDFLQIRPTEGSAPEESLARVGVNGEIETVAGVILHSPNGTRYRITVADDGSLTTEPA